MKLGNTGQIKTDHSPRKIYHDIMDDIDDDNLRGAVLLARKMIREKVPPGLANWKAADKYYVNVSDVASWVGKVASRVKKSKK